jgi:hypothetical protein
MPKWYGLQGLIIIIIMRLAPNLRQYGCVQPLLLLPLPDCTNTASTTTCRTHTCTHHSAKTHLHSHSAAYTLQRTRLTSMHNAPCFSTAAYMLCVYVCIDWPSHWRRAVPNHNVDNTGSSAQQTHTESAKAKPRGTTTIGESQTSSFATADQT